MKHNNRKFRKFWFALPPVERERIANKAGLHPRHVEHVARGDRKMVSTTAFALMKVDKRITMKMCFPEQFK